MLKTVPVFYAPIGSGHEMAAKAFELAEPVSDLRFQAVDCFLGEDIYHNLLNQVHKQSISTIPPHIYHKIWKNTRLLPHTFSLVETLLLKNKIAKILENSTSDMVLTTHVVPCNILVKLQPTYPKKIYAVVTDFDAHGFWPTKGVAGYFVANEETKNSLKRNGVKSTSIQVTGIPLRPPFAETADKMPENKMPPIKILLVASGLREGSYAEFQKYITDILTIITSFEYPYFLTLIKGSLQFDLSPLQKIDPQNYQILDYSHNICDLMLKHDVLITKLGGLIMAEALACGLCLINIAPNFGQEEANFQFFQKNNLGFSVENVSRLKQLLYYLFEYPHKIYEMKLRAKQFGRPLATPSIIQQLLKNHERTQKTARSLG